MKTPLAKFPEVHAPIDVATCTDPALLADAVCEVVPWKRRGDHRPFLHMLCGRIRLLLPGMTPRDAVRVVLSFGELYTKRRPHTLLFHDYETYAQLFQALPVEAATSKTLLPLMRAYRRMGVSHDAFIRVACDKVVDGTIELEPADLTELVKLLADTKLRMPKLFEHAVEVLDLKFAFFSEDAVGEFARSFTALKFRSDLLFETLARELPFRIHEYAWWNLIDIAEFYLVFQVDNRDVIQRIGNEVFKFTFELKYEYLAKALKVLAFLDAADSRTFRLLMRNQRKNLYWVDATLAADVVMACVAIHVTPTSVYHKLTGANLFHTFTKITTEGIGTLSAKKTCDVMAALTKAGQREEQFMWALDKIIEERPFKFHAEHLISLLRDFSVFNYKSSGVHKELLHRSGELAECSPSALCLLPQALYGQRPRTDLGEGGGIVVAGGTDAVSSVEREMEILSDAARLLCKPGQYRLPADARAMRSKDDFWWKQMRQRHFRLRRRAAGAGAGVDPAPEPEDLVPLTALAHVSREECLLLVEGCARIRWRDEPLLDGVAAWICAGSRHAEFKPAEVALVLDSLSQLGFAQPLLRAAMEHSLLRVAPDLPAADWARTLQGAMDLGIGVRSAAVRAVMRRCTSNLTFVPAEGREAFGKTAAAVLEVTEAETVSDALAMPQHGRFDQRSRLRLPVEAQMLRQAVQTMASPVDRVA